MTRAKWVLRGCAPPRTDYRKVRAAANSPEATGCRSNFPSHTLPARELAGATIRGWAMDTQRVAEVAAMARGVAGASLKEAPGQPKESMQGAEMTATAAAEAPMAVRVEAQAAQ